MEVVAPSSLRPQAETLSTVEGAGKRESKNQPNPVGKIRQTEEKRLRDPDDVFIHAEERKRELRKKQEK